MSAGALLALAPLVAATFVTALLGGRVRALALVAGALLVALARGDSGDAPAVAAGLAGAAFAASLPGRTASRVRALRHALAVGPVQLLALLAAAEFVGTAAQPRVCAAAFAAGSGAALFAHGIAPWLERRLRGASGPGLHELAAGASELHERLRRAAPSCAAHGAHTARLAAAGARALGLGPRGEALVRGAALHQDVGRLRSGAVAGGPFDEWTGTPEFEALRERAHVHDGVALLREGELPPELIALVAEHHGQRVIESAAKLARARGGTASEASYRFTGPRPSSPASAALFVANLCVEHRGQGGAPAAARALADARASGDLAAAGLDEASWERLRAACLASMEAEA